MAFVSITTLLDEGAVETIRRILDAATIPVEVHSCGVDVYFGSATTVSFQLRVPEEDVARAQQILARIAHTKNGSAIATPSGSRARSIW